jgi:DNA-binding transcriptional MocR family regulator
VTVQYQIEGQTAAAISASVESGVRRGALAAGQALPPVRELAGTLGVSPGTVAAAYQSLRQRGIVETAGRNGTRVRSRPAVANTRLARRPPVPPDVLDLSAGEPDPRLLPDPRPHLRRLAAADPGPASYRDGGVLPEFRDAARERLARDGVAARALTVTAGALDGIDRLLAAHLRPGDRVGVEDPGWANLLDLVAAHGLRPVPVPVDDEGPRPEGVAAALRAGIGALVVTTRAQNPTGAALSRTRASALRKQIRGYAAASGRSEAESTVKRPFLGGTDLLVIEDDHAAELSPAAVHPLAGATPHWAFLRSASKPYGPDLRLAALAGDEATVARVQGRMQVGAGWVSTVLQRLVLSMWQDAAVAAQVDRARDSYERRRDALLGALAERGIAAHGRTGLNVWVPVPDETAAVTRLRSAGYAVAPGSLYRQAAGPGVRITVAPLAQRDIPRLADALRERAVLIDGVEYVA